MRMKINSIKLYNRYIIFLALIISVNYIISLVLFLFYYMISDTLNFRIGYVPLLIGLVLTTIFVSDLLIYVYSFRSFIFKKDLGKREIRSLATDLVSASIPILIILSPYFISGIGGVVSEDSFYQATQFTMFTWGLLTWIYSLVIHPIYSPLMALSIIYCLNRSKRSFKCVYKFFTETGSIYIAFILIDIILTGVAVWILILPTTIFLINILPPLNTPLISVPQPSQTSPWSFAWANLINQISPRYYKLITDPIQYLLYTYILSRLSRDELRELG